MLYAGAILLGQGFVIPLTAYALSRFQFRGRDEMCIRDRCCWPTRADR